MKTKEEILKEATKGTLNINEGSPLHDAVMKAMDEYADQEVKKLNMPGVSNSVCRIFMADGKTTSATKCIFCGKEQWEH